MTDNELIEQILALRQASQNPDPFLVLGVSPFATPEEIRSAYKSRSLLLHPDKNRHPLSRACYDLVREAHDKLHQSDLAIHPCSYEDNGETFSLDRNSESYKKYDTICSKMLEKLQKMGCDQVTYSGKKRKDLSPLHSPDRDAMDQSSDREESCEDDSFECCCGEEKCTCRASSLKRLKSDVNSVPEAPVARSDCQFPSPMQLFSGFFSKIYEFIDCTPVQTSCSHPPAVHSLCTSSTNPNHVPAPRPKCHGLGLMRFLSSSTYSSELSSKGGVRKPCASAFCSKDNIKKD